MKYKKHMNFIGIGVLLLACIGIGGCGKQATGKPYTLEPSRTVDSGVIAENDRYLLEYDGDKGNISMQCKDSGKRWSTIPESYQGTNEDLLSAVRIEVIHNTTKTVEFERSYTASVATGHFSDTKIENGITVDYYFDTYEIMIPISYILCEDSLEIVVDTDNITEGETYRLLNVSIAPFLGSAANREDNAYLFVPTANGGLMYTDARPDGTRKFSAEVYGMDASRETWENPIEADSMKMPIFGVKDGDNALFAIIENGAEAATIQANAGDAESGYSNVCTTFYVRGYDVYASERDSNSTTTIRNAEDKVQTMFSVKYYPLTGEDADYNGMARLYREYLVRNGLQVSEESSPYALTILGGVKTRSLMFGIPYESVKKLTDMKEATDIIKDISDETGVYPTVQMSGYGTSGIDIGKIAGGFSFGKVSGSKRQYQDLEEFAKETGFLLSLDFDVVRFNSSGKGVNTWLDTAKSASLYKTKRYYNTIALSDYDKDSDFYYLVSSKKRNEVLERLEKTIEDYDISGVSLSTLGRLAYSDYGDSASYMKGNTEKSVQSALQRFSQKGIRVVTDDANIYAAVCSDAILNTTLETAELFCIDTYIPFYQIVLSGMKPIYSEAVNLTVDSEKTILKALESGTQLGYTVIGNYDTSYATTVHDNLYHSLYEDIKEQIIEDVAQYQDYYEAIQGGQSWNTPF